MFQNFNFLARTALSQAYIQISLGIKKFTNSLCKCKQATWDCAELVHNKTIKSTALSQYAMNGKYSINPTSAGRTFLSSIFVKGYVINSRKIKNFVFAKKI